MRIGELADLVGISARAIRHYHRVGLLPEPARRGNGYRDYSLRDAVELARVRRLVELGLSLAEVGDVLAGDADRDLAEILRELDADLAGQGADIRRRRLRLAQLLRQADEGMAAEQAHAVYALLDELAGSAVDDPRVEAAAHQILASIPEPARQAIRIPDGAFEEMEAGFAAAFYADFTPAQAAAIRLALKLMKQLYPADGPGNEQEIAP